MKVKHIIPNLAFFSLFVFPLISHAEYDEEVKFGFYADRFFISTHTILFDETLNKRITEIGNRVAKVSDKPDMKYIFRIVNDPVINAYSTAGSYVYINTGLLDVLESEDELAFIISHEVAHACKSHSIKFARAQVRSEVAGFILVNLLASAISVYGGLAIESANSPVISGVGQGLDLEISGVDTKLVGAIVSETLIPILTGYGKENEIEADTLAVQYTKKAGYNPNAAINVFKRFISIRDKLVITENNYVSKLINAEPGLEERIKNAELILNSDKNKQMK